MARSTKQGSTKGAVKGAGTTYEGQAATFVQVAKANGWRVVGGAQATARLPERAWNWGTKQGGTPAGALLATKGTAFVAVAVFTGRNGAKGRLSMALAGTTGGAVANVGSVRNALASLSGALPIAGQA